MRRRLLNLLIVLSLLLCVATCVLWFRSRSTIDVVAHRGERLVQVVSGGGRVYVQWVRFATRAGAGGPARAARPHRAGFPAAAPPPLTQYDETPGSYREWAMHREAIGIDGMMGPWEGEPSQRWWRTSTVANVSARARTSGSIQDWLVGFRWMPVRTAGTRAEALPGASRFADQVRSLESVHFDRENAAHPWVEEQWLTGWTAWTPLWTIVAASAALPAARLVTWSVRRLRSSRLTHQRRCVACGYDLRATPDRCPECGAAAPAEPAGLSAS